MSHSPKHTWLAVSCGIAVLLSAASASASIVLNGQTYSNEWITAHPDEVANYIKSNPEVAASIAANADPATQAVIYEAYKKSTGSTIGFDEAKKWADQSAAQNNAAVIIVEGKAYTNDWINANAAVVAEYIKNHPNYSATLLKNASPATLEAVRAAYNKINPKSPLSAADAKALVDKGIYFSDAWKVQNPGKVDDWTNPHKINDKQVEIWYAQNKASLTPAQIVDVMEKYKIDGRQMAQAMGADYSKIVDFLKPGSQAPVYTKTINALDANNYPTIYERIKNDGVTVGTRVGDTITYSNSDIKNFFKSARTVGEILEEAVRRKMTTSNVAQVLAISGVVKAYDPIAARNYVIALPGYALGPDDIIVRLAPGQEKDSKGMIKHEGQADTEWARAWYATGAGDVNGGKVDYGMTPPRGTSTSTDSVIPPGFVKDPPVLGLYPTGDPTIHPKKPSDDDIASSEGDCADIPVTLRYRDRDTGTTGYVSMLQDFLFGNEYTKIAPTGFFGSATVRAVKSFQRANKITPSGVVGELTRAKIKELDCSEVW